MYVLWLFEIALGAYSISSCASRPHSSASIRPKKRMAFVWWHRSMSPSGIPISVALRPVLMPSQMQTMNQRFMEEIRTAPMMSTMKETKVIPKMKGVLKRPLEESTHGPVVKPQASSFQLLRRQLENNQIQRVHLGFCGSYLTMSDYAKLCRAIRQNTSLSTVEIGWELPRVVLLRLLDSVARLPSLESLSLVVYTNLPKRLLRRLVSMPTLKHLELRNVQIGPSPWKERIILTATGGLVIGSEAQEHISVLANYFSDSIESLHVMACDMGEKDVNRFCKWSQRRDQPLKELGFEFSTRMAPECLEILSQRANCLLLDLTACGLNDQDASILAENLPKSKTIRELVVARNPLLGINTDGTPPSCPGVDEFLNVAFHHVKGLDLSCCQLSKEHVDSILQKLAVDKASSLESLTMFGIPKGCDEGHVLLQQILRNNTVLKSLRLRPTTDQYRKLVPSEEDIAAIEDCLTENYTLEHLQVGHTSLLIDMFLDLNHAGRRYLRNEPNEPVDWTKVLARASTRPDVMFWLLRNGVDHFF